MSVVERSTETEILLWLFGKPDWELDIEGAEVTEEMADEIELLGKELQVRLHMAGQIVRKLITNGWTGSGGLYDLWFSKAIPMEQAKKELATLGISEDDVTLEELEDEWEEGSNEE